MGFARFMASATGRLLRVVAGLILIYLGLAVVTGTGGWVLAAVGLLPLASGALNFCCVAPLLGAPFRGSALGRHG
jgi:hypothetical protein